MDMKSKGISWVGNIYQKLEAICEEVDDFMSQDKDKHEKNQIQAGCNTVRKFCTGVMQDLLLPSDDTCVRESVSDSFPPAKSEVTVPWEDSNAELLFESPTQKSHEEACDELIQKSIPVSIEINIQDSPEKDDFNSEKVADALISIDSGSVSQLCESLLPVILDNVGDNGIALPGCDKSSSTDITGIVFPCETRETMPLVESLEDGHNQHNKPVREASLPESETDVCVAPMSPMRRSSDSDWQEAYKSFSITEQSIEPMDEFEDVKLHDDCSDSEFLKNEIRFIYQKARRKISYKKKLRDAITSKLQPKKNQDYEQIAIWYAEAESIHRAGKLSTSPRDLCTERLQTQDSCDSDWELL